MCTVSLILSLSLSLYIYIYACVCVYIYINTRSRSPLIRMVVIRIGLVKVKCTLVQALRVCIGRTAHRGSRGVALLFLDHGTRRG